MNTRIAHIVQHLRPGGIETMALEMQRRALPGQQILLISLEGQVTELTQQWPRLARDTPLLYAMNKAPGMHPRLIWQLARRLRQLQVDVVHTHHIGPLFYGGLAARLAGVSQRIHTEHDGWHLASRKRLNLESWLLRLVRPVLVADAERVARVLRSVLPGSQPQVIHNGIDTRRFVPGNRRAARQALGLPEQGIVVGCAGRLEKEKGQALLLQAWVQVCQRYDANVHLVLAGGGSQQPVLQQLISDHGLGQRVTLLGPWDNMITFYQALNLYCQPSLSEGMPLSPLEAQACGVPCVLTDAGGSRETLCPDSGYLVPVKDVKALADGLIYQLEQGLEGVSPRAFVRQRFDIERMMQAYASLHGGPFPARAAGG